MTPRTILHAEVRPEWVDYNGHMNDAAYAAVFSNATDALMDTLGIDAAFRERSGYTVYTLEGHIRYHREAREGDPLAVTARLLDHDTKRLHVFFTLTSGATCLATGEYMLMGMDTEAGRPAPFPPPIAAAVDALAAEQADLETPPEAGRRIGIRR
ncbi:thioesterase family protein [Arhodomonas sp. AD133]|uniref:thioesterase family protein n=1 Tax=Arhodomonas sp. AD133 TaxID=3415009 RepID=UPI003EB9090F